VTLDRQPLLAGELLDLRPMRPSDFDALYAIASDPLLWEQHPSKDRTQRSVFEQWFDDAMTSGGALVAIDRTDGRVIGTSRFDDYDAARREVEIGWTFLDRSLWGGQYNREMKQLMDRTRLRRSRLGRVQSPFPQRAIPTCRGEARRDPRRDRDRPPRPWRELRLPP